MYRLQVKSHFDSAHYIKDYQGKCNRLHGHRWEVEVVLEGRQLDARNILVDFAHVKETLKRYLDEGFDHYLLNDTLGERNVTAEWLAKRIYDDLRYRFPGCPDGSSREEYWPIRLARVTIWESPECCVKYYGNEESYIDTIANKLIDEIKYDTRFNEDI